uniref:Uncharacterized protein n=1 Tax=Eutreptiella gymnastica TaxID=73025 RepID=A0A7S1NBK0_9EUGL|mmetsp:Transcript_150087/g.262110  ORF Transcript_150087/g.262110 Transcript_150087/m.262110 type:complete len:141 (+) Transcript_150087:1604-2026(+)
MQRMCKRSATPEPPQHFFALCILNTPITGTPKGVWWEVGACFQGVSSFFHINFFQSPTPSSGSPPKNAGWVYQEFFLQPPPNLCLAAVAVFIRRLRSAAHGEGVFSLIGHTQTPDRRNMSNDTLRHLTVMYAEKADSLDN